MTHLSILAVLAGLLFITGCGDKGGTASEMEEGLKTEVAIGVKPLLGTMPPRLREQCIPMAEVDLAFSLRHFAMVNEKALVASRLGSTHGTKAQERAVEAISRNITPGLELKDWLLQIDWFARRDGWGSSKYSYKGIPPLFELTLRIPEDLAGYDVQIWGHNYDFAGKRHTVNNSDMADLKKGDWVRVSGIVRDDSKVEWERGKTSEILSLGEIVITSIKIVEIGSHQADGWPGQRERSEERGRVAEVKR